MRRSWLGGLLGAAVIGGTAAGAIGAQTGDVFAFIPSGGRTLLSNVLATNPSADVTKAMLTGKHTPEEWLAELQRDAGTVPALKSLDETQLKTLASYLSYHMPLPPDQGADTAKADWSKQLPVDGRDMALTHCQSCHIITVVVTQDRARNAWLGTMHKPSHIGIKLTEQQREELADYLVLNAGIPIDQIPEDLRAGGATY
ncbi:MAG TPA: hypothetical protein VMB34_25640 [Acetobacteraceae bacterium]|nr:hypothetical protein [Acetobacteraceae bacterium]